MATPITDPSVIKFSNEQVRPLCEQARALLANINAMSNLWNLGISAKVTNDASAIVDNRTAEGVIELVGSDVVQAVSNLQAIYTASNAQIIQKPCVRSLGAS